MLFDPGDQAAPPCLNVLQGDGSGTDTDMIVDNVTGIFRRIFAGFWGPRTDDIFRAACLTLLGSVPPGSGLVTLADIPPLLGDAAVRKRLTAGVRDQVLKDFWGWYEELSPASRAAAVGPLMNKLRAFLLRRFAQAGDRGRAVHLRHEPGPRQRRAVPGPAAQGHPRRGDRAARRVASSSPGPGRPPPAAPGCPRPPAPDAGLYIDECQNFLNLPYPLEDMLAEARAYRLAVTMAHQNLAQLPPDLRQGISANARSQVIFSVSPEDAADLERHTAPVLTAHDLSHLDAYQAAARLVAGSAETARLHPAHPPAPAPGPGPGTARPQGGPRRPQRGRRHARAAARPGRRSRPPAAPPPLTAPSRTEGGHPMPSTVRPARPPPRRRAAGPQPAAGRRARRPAHRPRPVAAAHAAASTAS